MVICPDTLQGTNISPQKWHFEDDVPFPKAGYVNSLEGTWYIFLTTNVLLTKRKTEQKTNEFRQVWDVRRPGPEMPKMLRGVFHQEFQLPKMEVLNLVKLFWWWVFPYISLIYIYIGEYLHFRYLKCLVSFGRCWCYQVCSYGNFPEVVGRYLVSEKVAFFCCIPLEIP